VGGAFRGWTEDFQRFFIGLELDNSKRYFEANRKVYLERVKGPLAALLTDLEPEFTITTAGISLDARRPSRLRTSLSRTFIRTTPAGSPSAARSFIRTRRST